MLQSIQSYVALTNAPHPTPQTSQLLCWLWQKLHSLKQTQIKNHEKYSDFLPLLNYLPTSMGYLIQRWTRYHCWAVVTAVLTHLVWQKLQHLLFYLNVLILCKECFSPADLPVCLCPGHAELHAFFCGIQHKLQSAFHRTQLFMFYLICKRGITLTYVWNYFLGALTQQSLLPSLLLMGHVQHPLKFWGIFNSFSLPICCHYLKTISSSFLLKVFRGFLMQIPAGIPMFGEALWKVSVVNITSFISWITKWISQNCSFSHLSL